MIQSIYFTTAFIGPTSPLPTLQRI